MAQQLGPSALASITTDPKLKDAQNATLGQYDDIIDGGGFSNSDTASMNSIGAQIARRASAGRQGIQQGFASRGMANSGAAVAAQMGANADANQSLSEAGYSLSAAC